MLQREKYIKSIICRLSQLQVYIEMNNAAGLLDVDIIAEDFVCGLLNQIYGYHLENLNHQVRNAPAVDLADKNRRIFIQVTAERTRDKVQATIDKFIECKMYNQYGTLIIFLLTDIPQYKKQFNTKGVFSFDYRHNIWCFKDLVREIRKQDLEALKRIDVFLEKELIGHSEIADYSLKNGKEKITEPVLKSIIAVLLCFAIVFFILRGGRENRAGEVYYSKIQKYTMAGYYTSYEDIPFIKQEETEAEKAFSIVSFLRNEGDKASVVEEVYCRVLNLEPIEEAVLVPDAIITGNTLKFLVFNNGWCDAKNLDITIESKISNISSDIGDLEVISQCTYMEECSEIQTADVLFLAEYELDSSKFQEICEAYHCSTFYISLSGKHGDEEVFSWSAYLYYENDIFQFDYGGLGGPDYKITLFAVLDVDSDPPNICFDVTSIVEDALVLETVIAPTKSCIVECQNVFRVNGKLQKTPVYTIKVVVPVFADGAICKSGALTSELVQLSPGDRVEIERLIQKYLYQADSIRGAYSADNY